MHVCRTHSKVPQSSSAVCQVFTRICVNFFALFCAWPLWLAEQGFRLVQNRMACSITASNILLQEPSDHPVYREDMQVYTSLWSWLSKSGRTHLTFARSELYWPGAAFHMQVAALGAGAKPGRRHCGKRHGSASASSNSLCIVAGALWNDTWPSDLSASPRFHKN